MGLVMFSKKDRRKVLFFYAVQRNQFILQYAFQQKFFLEPDGHRGEERFHSFGRKSNVGFQKTLELDQGLVIEDEILEIRQRDTALLETVADGIHWKTGIELLACEALSLGCRHDVTVADQA